MCELRGGEDKGYCDGVTPDRQVWSAVVRESVSVWMKEDAPWPISPIDPISPLLYNEHTQGLEGKILWQTFTTKWEWFKYIYIISYKDDKQTIWWYSFLCLIDNNFQLSNYGVWKNLNIFCYIFCNSLVRFQIIIADWIWGGWMR